jgi:hypothetical protein
LGRAVDFVGEDDRAKMGPFTAERPEACLVQNLGAGDVGGIRSGVN